MEVKFNLSAIGLVRLLSFAKIFKVNSKRNSALKIIFIFIFFIGIGIDVCSQSYTSLPKPSTWVPGENSPHGYWEYLPIGYSTGGEKWPLILNLHGLGTGGNGTTDLYKVKSVAVGKILSAGTNIPFVVITPQDNDGWWNLTLLKYQIEYTIENYNVDPDRVYVTGVSAGAMGTWQFAVQYPELVAAIVPISGNGSGIDICKLTNIPTWAFHGWDDTTVSPYGSITPINDLNNCSPSPNPKAKLTMYPGVKHNAWDRTYNGSAMGTEDPNYDAFDMNIFDWFLQYTKKKISVELGNTRSITLPTNSVTINSTISSANSITKYTWTKQSGPTATLVNAATSTLTANGLVEGTYVFRLTVTDSKGNTAYDEVTVNVHPEVVNQAPKANAGTDQVIALPTNLTVFNGSGSDTDGSIASYSWTKVSGPAVTLQYQNTAGLTVLGLVEGTYVFRLTVTDDDGATGSDEVSLTVNGETVDLPEDELIGCWKLDNNGDDSSGNENNGSCMNNPSFTSDGIEGTHALLLNGTDQYLDIQNPDLLPSGKSPRSLSVWAKSNDIASSYRWAAAYGKASSSSAMFIGQRGKDLYAGAYANDISIRDFWEIGVWHHIVLTYDGSTAKLYADGIEIASQTKNWSLILDKAYIGRQVNGKEYWNGEIDDVRIYNKALTIQEIQDLDINQSTAQARKSEAIENSLSKNILESAKVYPNPVKDNLNIEIPAYLLNNDQALNFKLIDLMGNIVKDYAIDRSGIMTIDVTGLKNTTYVYFISSNDKVLFRNKLVKLTD